MLKKQRYEAFIQHFSENMPVAETELEYKNTFQLLVAVVLSAHFFPLAALFLIPTTRPSTSLA
jgi:hypothetical protein